MESSLAALIAAVFVPDACNTVEGVGKDIEAGGEKVRQTAEDVKQKMSVAGRSGSATGPTDRTWRRPPRPARQRPRGRP